MGGADLVSNIADNNNHRVVENHWLALKPVFPAIQPFILK